MDNHRRTVTTRVKRALAAEGIPATAKWGTGTASSWIEVNIGDIAGRLGGEHLSDRAPGVLCPGDCPACKAERSYYRRAEEIVYREAGQDAGIHYSDDYTDHTPRRNILVMAQESWCARCNESYNILDGPHAHIGPGTRVRITKGKIRGTKGVIMAERRREVSEWSRRTLTPRVRTRKFWSVRVEGAAAGVHVLVLQTHTERADA